MSRLQLDLPGAFIFSTEIPVRITDINYGGHLGNDSMLSILHESRIRFLNSLGYSEQNIGGAGIIMADAVVQFKSEAFYGTVLRIDIGAGDIQNSSFDLYYKVVDAQTGKEIARAKTNIVIFDYSRRRPVAMPDVFRKKISPVSENTI